MLNHRHIVVTAEGLAHPPKTAQDIEHWLLRLVDAVGMKTLMGPYAIRCETVGNEGVTGIVCIETSHASLHCWDCCEVPYLKMDLYSCMHFDAKTVMDLISEFGPVKFGYTVFDRNGTRSFILEEGWNFDEDESESLPGSDV